MLFGATLFVIISIYALFIPDPKPVAKEHQ
jgi:hypothetical protein